MIMSMMLVDLDSLEDQVSATLSLPAVEDLLVEMEMMEHVLVDMVLVRTSLHTSLITGTSVLVQEVMVLQVVVMDHTEEQEVVECW